MDLVIIWNNGDKHKEKNVDIKAAQTLVQTVLKEGCKHIRWGYPNKVLNLEYAREIYLEE